MRRQIILSLLLVVTLLLAGTFGMLRLIKTKPKPPQADTERPPLAVRGTRLEPCSTVEPIAGFGTAQADRQAWVAAEAVGQVVELADDLRAGAAVRAGQVLIRIDDREYQAALDRARSQLMVDQAALKQIDVEQQNLASLVTIAEEELTVAQRELARVRDLLEQGHSNPREADQARLAFEGARRTLRTLVNQQALLPERRAGQQALCDLRRADVAIAELNHGRCTVKAPFAGRLNEVRVEVGERVAPGQQLLSIVDLTRIEVSIELPVSLRGRVRIGRSARLSLESGPDVIWTGRVARIGPSANELTRTFSLFVEVDNSAQEVPLVPGMFVRAHIDGPTLENVLIVPRGSIQDGRVFVCRDGHAYPQDVHIDRHLLDRTVVSGLEPGAVVITSNLDALYDGAPVEVLLDEPMAPPAAQTQPAALGAALPARPPTQSSVKTP